MDWLHLPPVSDDPEPVLSPQHRLGCRVEEKKERKEQTKLFKIPKKSC